MKPRPFQGQKELVSLCHTVCQRLERDCASSPFHAAPHQHFLFVPDFPSLSFSPKANSSPSSSLLSPIILSNQPLSLERLESLLVDQVLDQPFWKTRISGIQMSEINP